MLQMLELERLMRFLTIIWVMRIKYAIDIDEMICNEINKIHILVFRFFAMTV